MAQPSQQWSHKDTEALIRWRMGHGYLFSGWRNTCRNGWELFIQETKSNLDGNITSQRAKRKWENLKCKYKVLKALAKDVETVKPESWRWFRLMEKAVDGDPTDADPPKPTLLTNLADESECAAQPSKKMYQVEMGSDILELLTHSVIEVNTQATVADEGPSSDTAESVKGRSIKKSPPETQDELQFERTKLRRERQLLEKEHADLDRERVLLEREKAIAEREKTALERDRAQLVKDRAAIDRERASLEQDRARLEGDRAALERDRETFTAMALDTNSTGHTEPDSPFAEDRKRLIFLFEKLIERF
uniref:Zgc:113426 n=1 Tax=Cyprinus carpio TaxID=7962 RepID=A0A8C2E1Y4_CYPCA